MILRKISTLFLIFLLQLGEDKLFAQYSIQDSSISFSMIQVTYRGLFAGGDMADRYGFGSLLGVDLGYKFKNSFYVSGGVSGLFGDDVKEMGMLDNLTTPAGFLINNEGLVSDFIMRQSGYAVNISGGKIFPVISGLNPNSGFFLEVGGQFLQHRIKISATDGEVPAIMGAYEKGYDRLANGFGVRESVGFRYYGNRGYVNIVLAADLSQNFTRSRRTINFDTGIADKRNRLDLLTGFRVSWIFMIYNKAPDKVYYY